MRGVDPGAWSTASRPFPEAPPGWRRDAIGSERSHPREVRWWVYPGERVASPRERAGPSPARYRFTRGIDTIQLLTNGVSALGMRLSRRGREAIQPWSEGDSSLVRCRVSPGPLSSHGHSHPGEEGEEQRDRDAAERRYEAHPVRLAGRLVRVSAPAEVGDIAKDA